MDLIWLIICLSVQGLVVQAVPRLPFPYDSLVNHKTIHRLSNHTDNVDVVKLSDQVPINTYCSLLRTQICGPCRCVDERRLPEKYYCDCRNVTPKRDCLEFRQNGYKTDGVYMVTQNRYKTIEVFCDQTTNGGGWTVFQRRFDGSINFHRDWEMYKVGFGDFQFEHWLGNENINTLILQGLYNKGSELRIDMMNWDGSKKYANYKYFQVGTELTAYQLNIRDYSGTAGDSLSKHNKMGFTTIDRDNDSHRSRNCAQMYYGGWWFTNCIPGCNLNGHYYELGRRVPNGMGISWYSWGRQKISLKRTEMKFRRNV